MALSPSGRGEERALAQRGTDQFNYLRRQIDRVFDDIWSNPWQGRGGEIAAGFTPVDVTDTEKEVKVSAEIPGIDPKDIEVAVENGVLIIRGEKKHEHEENEKGRYRIERSYGSFQRAIELPVEVDESKAKAEYKNGVLRLTLPKKANASPKRKTIPIT